MKRTTKRQHRVYNGQAESTKIKTKKNAAYDIVDESTILPITVIG